MNKKLLPKQLNQNALTTKLIFNTISSVVIKRTKYD